MTEGDLFLLESCNNDPEEPLCIVSDVIRFNVLADGSLNIVFYSDNLDGSDALADTGFPEEFYANTFSLLEVGAEGSNGIPPPGYIPQKGTGGASNQPGYLSGLGGVAVYIIQSDSPANQSAPEPATLALLGVGLAALGFSGRRKLKH